MDASDPERPGVTLRPVSMLEALTGALREQILDGRLPAGSALREADLCATFSVSRHTLRTALRALAHEGVVRLEANRGASVPRLNAQDVADLFALRTVLEVHAVRALAGDPSRRPPVELALRSLRDLGPDASWGEVRDADIAFHRALVDALGSQRISRTYGALATEVRLSFLQLQPEFEDARAVAAQHERIYSAVEAGDADLAERLLREHLETAVRDIVASAGTDG
jgi:DNA-binding GntR family transcriptional regulator